VKNEPVSTTTKPVTQTAEVAVKMASIQEILPPTVAPSSLRSAEPKAMSRRKLNNTNVVGLNCGRLRIIAMTVILQEDRCGQVCRYRKTLACLSEKGSDVGRAIRFHMACF
jgi:hypothetical protein